MITLLLQVIALVLLFLAAINKPSSPHVSFFPLGMFFWLLSLMLGGIALHPIH
jgi:hypothetical protein